ncbi:MAG: D-aminoacyl-tRNA deacylase [Nitrospinota bacterium]
MRAVIQRVREARVVAGGKVVGEVGRGLVTLLGVGREDTEEDARYLADKAVHLRIFGDEEGRMNRSLLEVGGSMLVVSQFTLYGDARKGRRPSFIEAAPPERAEALYGVFVREVEALGVPTATGSFGALMEVELVNEGPVTLLLHSRREL